MYGLQCNKRLWLHKNLPGEKDVSTSFQQAIFKQGNEVGDLAKQLFPGGVDASPENPFSYQKSVADTMKYIRNGHQVIYEAAFQFEGILCALDILVKVDNHWYAFEVKSTTGVKEPHILDAALQYYVLTGAGINLSDISIIHLNREYVRKGGLDIRQLFTPVSILEKVRTLQPELLLKAGELLVVLSKNYPPANEVGEHCLKPYVCDFQKFCNKGILPLNEVRGASEKELQILKKIRDQLAYPVSFLHLDTWNNCIPLFERHWPYKQVCFQYSVYKIANAEASPEHFYYLNEQSHDPKELIGKLLSVLGEKGSIVVHHESSIRYILMELGKEFAWLNPHIQALLPRIKELTAPFRKDSLFNNETSRTLLEKSGIGDTNAFPIRDSRSASAGYYNVTFGKTEDSAQIMFGKIKNYAQQSCFQLMHWLF